MTLLILILFQPIRYYKMVPIDSAIYFPTFLYNNLPFLAAPQIAASNGDCTFEVDECGWSNVVSRERLDDIDWERTSGAALRSAVHDHTLGTEKGYLMTLSRSTVQRPGSRAWFTSRDFKTNAVPRCLSFW